MWIKIVSNGWLLCTRNDKLSDHDLPKEDSAPWIQCHMTLYELQKLLDR